MAKENNLKRGYENLGNSTEVDIDGLKNEIAFLNKKATELEEEIKKSKFDLVTLLGVFVGLITYLGLEIQVFKTIDNPLMIIGISMFFISSIILFILGINTIIKKYETFSWNDFKDPIYIVLGLLLIISIYFIICGYRDYSKSQFLEYKIYQINQGL